MSKKTITEPATKQKTPPVLPEITGNRELDLQAYRKSRSVDLGIKLLEHYVPENTRLIDYCRMARERKYITENLNIILHGND